MTSLSLRSIPIGRPSATLAVSLALVMALESPARLVVHATTTAATAPVQAAAEKPLPGSQPSTMPATGQPLPPETIRQANLAIEQELEREAALISGDRVGTDGAPVAKPVELGLILTRDLWVALLRHRTAYLAGIKELSREEKLALLEKLRAAAGELRDAHLNVVAAEGAALNPDRHERAWYEDQLREAEAQEQAAKTATTPAARDHALQAAQQARDRAARSPWKFYSDRRDTFFGLLQQNEANGLLGLYQDNWVMPNRYLFQTLMHTAYSSDPTERADEMIADLDSYLDANVNRLQRIADKAEAIDDFEDLLEYASPKYARIHELARQISTATGVTAPAGFVYPLADIGRSFELAEVFGDIVLDLLIAVVCLGTMVIPVVGAIVNSGVALAQVVNEGGELVVRWSDANEARRTAAITGYRHVISADDKTRASAGRLIFAVIDVAGTVPFVPGVTREARAGQIQRARDAARYGTDLPLSELPTVQRGAARALALGIPKDAVDSTLRTARTLTREEMIKKLEPLRAKYSPDEFDDLVEQMMWADLSLRSDAANAFSQINRLDEFIAAARAAGVENIDEMVQAAVKTGDVYELGQRLPKRLMRLALSKRGITVAVDNAYSGPYRIDGRTEQVADVPWHHYNDFWYGTPPIDRTVRADFAALRRMRDNLQAMMEGKPVVWSPGEFNSLQHVMKRPDLATTYVFNSDQKILEELFPGEMIEFGRRFVSDPNAGAIAIGQRLLPPGAIAPEPAGAGTVATPTPGAPSGPLARWIVTGTAGKQALEATADRRSRALEQGIDPFSDEALVGEMSQRWTGGAPAGAAPLTEYDLESAAIAKARTQFGTRVAQWTTSVLHDGSVAATSPDQTKRVTASAATGADGLPRIHYQIDSLRNGRIEQTLERQFKIGGDVPTDRSTLPPLEGPTRPVGSPANSSAAPAPTGGGAASTPRDTSARPVQSTPRPDTALASNTSGMPASIGAANEWTPLGGAGTTIPPATGTATGLPSSGASRSDVAAFDRSKRQRLEFGGLRADHSAKRHWSGPNLASTLNHTMVNDAKTEPAVQSILSFMNDSPVFVDDTHSPPAALRAVLTTPAGLGRALVALAIPTLGFRMADVSRPVPLIASRGRSGSAASQPTAADELPTVKAFFTSLGETSGEAFRMVVVNESGTSVELSTDGFVLEPLARLSQADVDRELQRLESRNRTTATVLGYCLEFAKLGPPPGMIFRIASRPVQEKFAGARPVLRASKTLFDAGELTGGSGGSYLHAVRQWAIWTLEQRFDEASFGRAFLDHAKKNVAAARRPWTRDLEGAVRRAVPGRWQDVRRVLDRVAQQNVKPQQ